MRAYVRDGYPEDIYKLIRELQDIEGVIIHKVNQTTEDVFFYGGNGTAKILTSVQVIFFAADEEVANFLALKYPPDTFRSVDC